MIRHLMVVIPLLVSGLPPLLAAAKGMPPIPDAVCHGPKDVLGKSPGEARGSLAVTALTDRAGASAVLSEGDVAVGCPICLWHFPFLGLGLPPLLPHPQLLVVLPTAHHPRPAGRADQERPRPERYPDRFVARPGIRHFLRDHGAAVWLAG